jgi:NifU-like protein involved in Fe-S cluster formation
VTARPRAALYTTELLALAVSLAERPFDPEMPLAGEARSRTCGSTLRMSCATDAEGRLTSVGMQVSACAVGQAAAALFAKGAVGLDAGEVGEARGAIWTWLAGEAEQPDWPGLDALATVRAHPARHGAVLLAWDAALAALSKAEARG